MSHKYFELILWSNEQSEPENLAEFIMVFASIQVVREIFMWEKTCVQFHPIFPFFDKSILTNSFKDTVRSLCLDLFHLVWNI